VTGPSRLPRGGTQDVFFPRTASSDMPTIVGGDGIHVIDDRGRRLLDVASGPFLANLGQGNERVLQAMLEQGRRLTYTYSRTTRHAANAKLTEQLAALAGPGFERVHLTSGGSEAVEMALKFLRQHAVANGQPERHRVISITLARFPADRDPGAVVLRHGRDHGLLLYSRRQNAGRFGDWLLIAPPLVIDEAGCDELLGGLSATLDDAASELLGG